MASNEIVDEGGDYQSPFSRPIDRSLKDLRNGFVSGDKKLKHYGVDYDPIMLRQERKVKKKRKINPFESPV
jgi:hypothetical protein